MLMNFFSLVLKRSSNSMENDFLMCGNPDNSTGAESLWGTKKSQQCYKSFFQYSTF